MTLEARHQLLHYQLIEKIGEGGMGVVWKALDTSLDREVAIKVLPEAFASDALRLARFEREAKLLASLNHPNVATVFGVHEDNGTRFLAMELVPGEDLSERLRRGRLSVAESVRIARSIAEGLEAAHAGGVIHRDLKPANVRIVADGGVKILDFGLAKERESTGGAEVVASLSPTMTRVGSEAGVLLGTLAYMSPEQARGQTVDERSDVWALGCVLWECLTARTLFGGKTLSDSIGAILHTEPDWERLPAETPPRVRRLLRRCLAKDARKRLHHMADARIELEDDDPSPVPVVAASSRKYKLAVVGLALAVVASLMAAVLSSSSRSNNLSHNPLAGARFTRITDFAGTETDATISPDGRFVAFVSDRDGPFDIFVGQIGPGEFRNLTQGMFGRPQGTVRNAGFNGDGSEIWITGGASGRLRTVPLLGGPFRNFLGEDVINVEWSPDGERIVFHNNLEGDPVYVADADGTNSRMILGSDEGMHQHYPMWSPDGQWIYLARGRQTTAEMDLWRVRPDGAALERLTEDKLDVRYPTPLDERTVLYVASDEDGAGPWLWTIDVETRVSRRASVGLEEYSTMSASADRRRLVATVRRPRAKLWSVPILDRVATEENAEPVDVPSSRALGPRFGGASLFYLSSRGSGDGLWRLEGGEATEIWRGSEAPLLEPAAVSPDGASLALLIRRAGERRLHVLSADGARLQVLSESVDARGAAAWSPDGRWVVTEGVEAGVIGLYKIPVNGGAAERIADGEALNPVWSPDGGLIVYAGAQVNSMAPILGLRPDGTPVALPEIEVQRAGERIRFLPDGSGLVYLRGRLERGQDFWLLDLASMESRELTRLDQGDRIRTFDITPDGQRIVFDRLGDDSDIALIELPARGE